MLLSEILVITIPKVTNSIHFAEWTSADQKKGLWMKCPQAGTVKETASRKRWQLGESLLQGRTHQGLKQSLLSTMVNRKSRHKMNRMCRSCTSSWKAETGMGGAVKWGTRISWTLSFSPLQARHVEWKRRDVTHEWRSVSPVGRPVHLLWCRFPGDQRSPHSFEVILLLCYRMTVYLSEGVKYLFSKCPYWSATWPVNSVSWGIYRKMCKIKMQFCHQPFLVLTNYNISTSLPFFLFSWLSFDFWGLFFF